MYNNHHTFINLNVFIKNIYPIENGIRHDIKIRYIIIVFAEIKYIFLSV